MFAFDETMDDRIVDGIENVYNDVDSFSRNEDELPIPLNGTKAENEAARDAMRNELKAFLLESKNKVDENGEPTIIFPNNFDDMANMMDRSDLTHGSSWCTHIFSDKFSHTSKDRNSIYDRYSSTLSEPEENNKLQLGLAQIELLDKKLKRVIKKEIQLKHTTLNQQQSDTMDDTPRILTANSSSNSAQDIDVFLTRTDFMENSQAKSRPQSSKSSASTKSTKRKKDRNKSAYPNQSEDEYADRLQLLTSGFNITLALALRYPYLNI